MRKNIILTIGAILLTISSYAQNSYMQMANKAYEEERYAEADSLYQVILQSGKESAVLYYNLGNVKYKQNELGQAILNYERALILDPQNEDALFNLEMAKSMTVDKIDVVEKFFLTQWNSYIRQLMSSNGWARTSIALFILTLIAVAFYFFGNRIWIRKLAFSIGVIGLIFCIISFNYAKSQKQNAIDHEYAIILSPTLTGKGSPDTNSTDLFQIHEGTKVKVKSKVNDWMEIQLEDGSVGWIPANTAEVI